MQCEYTRGKPIFLGYKDGKEEQYTCPHNPVMDGYCTFHHPSYWKQHPDDVKKEFYNEIRSKINSNQGVVCVGYNLPDINIKELGIDRFGHICFRNCHFQSADFARASFKSADFMGATFESASFWDTTFELANFERATFKFANFQFAKFGSGNFTRATFESADFAEAVFESEAYFGTAIFKAANFGRTTFKSANFGGATFNSAANFKGAKFGTDAYFEGAKFESEADFGSATFNSASFGDSTFKSDAHFDDAIFKSTTYFLAATFKSAIFARSIFESATFFLGAAFRSADFTAATFGSTTYLWDTTFESAKFERARFRSADFTDVLFGSADFSFGVFDDIAVFKRRKPKEEEKNSLVEGSSKIGKIKTEGTEKRRGSRKPTDHWNDLFRAELERAITGEADQLILFHLVTFRNPRSVTIIDFPLKDMSFLLTNVTEIMIISRVEKGDILSERLLKEKFKGKDEQKGKLGESLAKLGPHLREETVLAEYRSIRKSFERNRTYVEASELYIKEMKLLRKSLKWYERVIHYLYGALSRYGESFVRPLLISIVMILGTPLLLCLLGNSLSPQTYTFNLMNTFLAFFQMAIEDKSLEIPLRIASIILFGNMFIAFRRKLERR